MKHKSILLLVMATVASAGVRVYDVQPVGNVHGSTIHDDDNLIQTFVAMSDSLLAVDLFEGALPPNWVVPGT